MRRGKVGNMPSSISAQRGVGLGWAWRNWISQAFPLLESNDSLCLYTDFAT